MSRLSYQCVAVLCCLPPHKHEQLFRIWWSLMKEGACLCGEHKGSSLQNFSPDLKKCVVHLLYSLTSRLQDGAKANAFQLLLLHVRACTSSQHISPADRTLCVICIVDTLVPPHLQRCLVAKQTVFSCIKTHPRSPPCHHTTVIPLYMQFSSCKLVTQDGCT